MRHLALRLVRNLKETEYYSRTFLQGMLDRIAVSHHKYGNMSEAYPHDVDSIKTLKERLALYIKTGNTEWLIDVANQAMIEFMYPAHKKAHFRPTDSNESPGLQAKQKGMTNELAKLMDDFDTPIRRKRLEEEAKNIRDRKEFDERMKNKRARRLRK